MFWKPTRNLKKKSQLIKIAADFKSLHCKVREIKLLRNSLNCAATAAKVAAQNKSINQNVPARAGMILFESLFNVPECIKRSFPGQQRMFVIQENNLFALASQLRCCFLFRSRHISIRISAAQLCDVCLSVRRDKRQQKEARLTKQTLVCMIHHKLWDAQLF